MVSRYWAAATGARVRIVRLAHKWRLGVGEGARARASPGSPLSRERADVMRRRARASELAGVVGRARGVKQPTNWIYETAERQTESCFPNANE